LLLQLGIPGLLSGREHGGNLLAHLGRHRLAGRRTLLIRHIAQGHEARAQGHTNRVELALLIGRELQLRREAVAQRGKAAAGGRAR
jgi:hypothetical protein